jgi:hypothetical protein
MKKSFHLILLCILAGFFVTALAQKATVVNPNLDVNVHSYVAPVMTPDDLLNVYPQNVNYWTGTCNQTTKTQVSLVNGIEYEVGWMVFDVSGIPLGATINSITFNGYVYDSSWPYWSITPMGSINPITGLASDIYTQISSNYLQTIAYSYNTEPGNIPPGNISRVLGNTATTDLQNTIPQGWFAIGITEWELSTSYWVYFQGWAEANKPYLTVDYTVPTAHDVGTQSVDLPGLVTPGVVVPKATVFSQSTTNETFNVTMTITPGGYSSTKTVTNLAPGGTQQVTFDNWNATLGSYTVEACTQLGTDPNPANDCMSKPVQCLNVVEEIFGSNANMFGPAGQRGRGNIFYCNNPRKLVEHRMYLNPGAGTNLWFVVYEGTSFNGTYNLVNSTNFPGSGPGEGWYNSGAIDFDFQNGLYYMIYALFDVSANYFNQQSIVPYPIPCSFGELISGVGWNWSPVYASPPNPTETPTELENSGVAYYQTIVTDNIIPVELLSFTFQTSDNNVTLNWVTATETNNSGYEIERKTDGDFSTIAFISGYGTSTETHRYSYSDQNLQPGVYSYRLKQIDLDGTFYYYNPVVVEVSSPAVFALDQNYPNPFNPSTKIAFRLAVDSKVSLKVFDVLGQEVANLVNTNLVAGSHNVDFDASSLNSGVYMYRIEATGIDGTNFVDVKKMILTR